LFPIWEHGILCHAGYFSENTEIVLGETSERRESFAWHTRKSTQRRFDMTIKPIKTERDYRNALKEIEKLWNAKPNSPKGDRLDVLVTLVEAYEQKHYKVEPPDAVEAVKFRMEQLGLKSADLAKILGGRSRASEVLNKKRKLTVDMMRSLRKHLGVPAESLLA
jgi:HTH-type transcriptional regulator/antitoxin HigA